MKSYTLGNWDGGLTNGNTSASTSSKTPEHVDFRKIPARTKRGPQVGALNANGHIPITDTRYSSVGSRRRETNEPEISLLNGVQHANVFHSSTSPSTRFTMNGCGPYPQNGTQSNFPFARFNNKPSLGHNSVPGYREDPLKSAVFPATATSSQVPVSSQHRTHSQGTTAPIPQDPSNVRDTTDDQVVSVMDVDDSGSSADAEGEEAEEESDDALLIRDMLLHHEPSSCTPTYPSDSTEKNERQLSPLFTPATSPKANNLRKPLGSPFVAWPPSPVARTTAHFPSRTPRPPLPPSSPPSLAEDIFSLPITTTNPQKKRIEVAKPRRRKRKRMVLSHVEVPPFPPGSSKESYPPLPLSISVYSTVMLPRSAKQLARLKMQKTMAETRRIASEINLDVGKLDDERDPTYKPSSYSVKRNTLPGSSRGSVVPCSVSSPPPAAVSRQTFDNESPNTIEPSTQLDHPGPVHSDTAVASAKEPSPFNVLECNVMSNPPPLAAVSPQTFDDESPNTTETSTQLDNPGPVHSNTAIAHAKEPSPFNVVMSNPPTPAPEPTPTAVQNHITPLNLSTQDLSSLDSSPLSPLPSSPTSCLSLSPLRKAEKKRTYKKRLREERETESDNPKLKKKSKTAQSSRSGYKKRNSRNTAAEAKERRATLLSGYCQYDFRCDILELLFDGIPPTQHAVLAMNTRHVRQCKDLHQVQNYVSVIKGRSAISRPFLVPLLSSAADKDQYYLGGAVRELIEVKDEEDVVEAPLLSKKSKGTEKEVSASQAVIQKAHSMIPSVSRSGSPSSITPEHFGEDQDDAGYVGLETESILYVDHFFNDLSLNYSSQQQSSSNNNFEPLSGNDPTSHRPHDDEYHSETLSRALVFADRDPFLSSGNNWTLHTLDSPTTDTWSKPAEFLGDRHFSEPGIVNDTIDPSILRGDDFEEPPATPDDHQQDDATTSRPLSPQPVDDGQSQQPCSELDISPADDDPFLSPPPGSPPSISTHRLVVAPRRFSDMVDIRDLDLDLPSSHASGESDDDQATEDKDPAYTASSSKPEAGTSRRQGPRIVSAKELAKIQRQKALEREKEQQRTMAAIKGSLPPSQPPSQPSASSAKFKKPGRNFKNPSAPTRPKWESGPDFTSCHHCRTRSYRLKMACKCGKSWCNMCILTKYDNHPFDANIRDWVCPCCRDACRCDLCTKRRGETYVSKRTWASSSRMTATDAKVQLNTRSRERVKTRRNSFLSSEGEADLDVKDDEDEESGGEPAAPVPKRSKRRITLHSEKPFPPTEIVGTPGSHWGAVYSLTGERVATATVGEGNRTVTVSCSVEALLLAGGISRRKKRVFIGHVQPCWGHDMVHGSKVRQLQDGSEDHTVKRLTRDDGVKRKDPCFRKRVYIGKPEVFLELHKRDKAKRQSTTDDVFIPDVEPTGRFSAYSLSPLSSLSSLSDSDREDHGGNKNSEGKIKPGTNSAFSGLYGDSEADPGQERDYADAFNDADRGEDGRGKPRGVLLVTGAVKDGQKVVGANNWGCVYNPVENATDADKRTCEQVMEMHGDGKDAGFGLISLTEEDVTRAIMLGLSALRVPT